jgi:hypothetical protein
MTIVQVLFALVNWLACVTITAISVVAFATKCALHVGTRCISVAQTELTLINVDTLVADELVSRSTDTFETTLLVFTLAIGTTRVVFGALVDIGTWSVFFLFEAVLALTFELARLVDTITNACITIVQANFTLVNVIAVDSTVAIFTLAAEWTNRIGTSTRLATCIFLAFVNITAYVSITVESTVACALIRALSVNTLGMSMTSMCTISAFVNVDTSIARVGITNRTVTRERAQRVDTFCIVITGDSFTLVNIDAIGAGETILALALIATFSVDAISICTTSMIAE